MKPPSTALLRTFSPLWQSQILPSVAKGCLAQQQQKADFSSTRPAQARKNKGGKKVDTRISMASLGLPILGRRC